MRQSFLLGIGVLFLGATLLELGYFAYLSFPPPKHISTHIPGEILQIPTSTPIPGLVPGTTIQHQVLAGEWPLQIARCYGASLQEVLEANPFITGAALPVQRPTLTIPNIGSVGKVYGPPCVVFYTVQSGESPQSIAQKFNSDLDVLMSVNKGNFSVGRIIIIPINSRDPAPPLCNSTQILSLPADPATTTVSGVISGEGTVCFVLDAGQAPGVSIEVVSHDAPVRIAIAKRDETVIKPAYDPSLSWMGSALEIAASNVVIFSDTAADIVNFTLEVITFSDSSLPTPTKTLPTPAPGLKIEAVWPSRLGIGESRRIRVSLFRPGGDTDASPMLKKGDTPGAYTAVPVGTSGVSPELAFGSGYELFANGTIDATIIVSPTEHAPRPMMDESPIVWEWIITSDTPGWQSFNLYIDLEWLPVNKSATSFKRRIWEPKEELQVYVFQPFITKGTVSIATLVTAFLGTITVPFLIMAAREKKKETKSRRE